MRLPFLTEPTRHFGRRWLVLPGQSGFWNYHTGCDWTRNSGTPIPAADTGVVIGNYFTSLKGWQLVVRNKNGRITRYHMLKWQSDKAIGSTVTEGEIIGQVGSSGTASTGAHLHFEIWINGVPVDPYKYVTGQTAGDTSTPINNEEDMPLTPEDIEKIWAAQITANGKRASIAQHIAEMASGQTGIPARSAAAVWDTTVARTGGPVAALQELATAKTNTILLLAAVGDLKAPASAVVDYEKLASAIVAKLPAAPAPLTKADVVDAIKSVTLKAQ